MADEPRLWNPREEVEVRNAFAKGALARLSREYNPFLCGATILSAPRTHHYTLSNLLSAQSNMPLKIYSLQLALVLVNVWMCYIVKKCQRMKAADSLSPESLCSRTELPVNGMSSERRRFEDYAAR